MAFRPGTQSDTEDSSIEEVGSEVAVEVRLAVEDVEDRRIRALDVFFCRREYVFPGVVRRAAVGEEVRVRL